MDKDTYLSISSSSSGQYKEKGSKFLAFAYPVVSEEEVTSKLVELKKKYHDARHHCYAYFLGQNQSIYRAYDDGEPKHSAGDPILNQIKSFNLSDTLVVVVRYFGGTKLGIPRLINAYKTSAREVLANSKIIKRTVCKNFYVFSSYESMNEIMRLTKEFDIEVFDQQFTDKCQVQLSIKISQLDKILDRLSHMKDVTFEIVD